MLIVNMAAEIIMREPIILYCVCGSVNGGPVWLSCRLCLFHSYGRRHVNTSFHLLTSSQVLFIIINKSFQRPAAMFI